MTFEMEYADMYRMKLVKWRWRQLARHINGLRGCGADAADGVLSKIHTKTTEQREEEEETRDRSWMAHGFRQQMLEMLGGTWESSRMTRPDRRNLFFRGRT